MRSTAPGNDTSICEVTHISSHGIWLFAHNEEFFMSYEDFPWFKKQPIEAVLNVEEPSPDHYYWPAIDVDLTKEIIENPDRFPLKAKVT
ncbi:MAG: DUF2442 domain-containing protein [Gammaproteobacteria bacterium]|nr:DUF2442 domain-containing protein [Gammaproteobacteria bacterium]